MPHLPPESFDFRTKCIRKKPYSRIETAMITGTLPRRSTATMPTSWPSCLQIAMTASTEGRYS